MNEKILVILILIVVAIYLFYFDKIEQFTQNMRLTNIYGSNNARTKKDELYEIGVDNNNEPIYEYKNSTFKLGEDNSFDAFEPKKVKYFPVAIKIPSVITSKKIKSKVPMKIDGFKFKGLVANSYYNQYFILYEKEYTNYDREDKLFEYLLVKKIDNKFKTVHKIPPRNKIEIDDTVYFSYGNFQLGPLKFV